MKKFLLGMLIALCAVAYAQDNSVEGLTIGFSQIGSESGWRTAETQAVREAAQARGVNLLFSDAQQKQENQIKALRSFIAQGVDAILLAPVVESGWNQVLQEAQDAEIPVVLLDRGVDADPSLYLTKVSSDFVKEGRLAGEWLAEQTDGTCNIVELQGTVGSSAAIDRQEGFAGAIAKFPEMNIIRSETGDFTRTGGKTVMESFLKSENPADICAVFAHNDDMALGAIQSIEEAGLKPSEDMVVVSVDGVPDIFKAMADGKANATVELAFRLGDPAFDAIAQHLAGEDVPKWVVSDTKMYFPDTAAAEYAARSGQ